MKDLTTEPLNAVSGGMWTTADELYMWMFMNGLEFYDGDQYVVPTTGPAFG